MGVRILKVGAEAFILLQVGYLGLESLDILYFIRK